MGDHAVETPWGRMALDGDLDAYLLTVTWRRQPGGVQRRDALGEVLEEWGRPVDANALCRWLAYRHRADTINVITDQWHDVQVRARDAWDGIDVVVRLEGEVLSEALADVVVVLRWLERLPSGGRPRRDADGRDCEITILDDIEAGIDADPERRDRTDELEQQMLESLELLCGHELAHRTHRAVMGQDDGRVWVLRDVPTLWCERQCGAVIRTQAVNMAIGDFADDMETNLPKWPSTFITSWDQLDAADELADGEVWP